MFKYLPFLFLLCYVTDVDAQGSFSEPLVVEGSTMGTTYRILYFDEPRRRDFKSEIDSLLVEINKAINTYDPASEISKFNKSTKGIVNSKGHLQDVLQRAKVIYKKSAGAFDPTVMPLVNAWGFGPDKSFVASPEKIDSLKNLVGFRKIKISRKRIRKKSPFTQLDLGGIGQGYGVDAIDQFLRSKGIVDMLVELGGEGMARGKNLHKQMPWTVGILNPQSTRDDQFFKGYVTLRDQSFTTSGNYFNYKIIDGRRYGHTIDPITGYPVQHNLLSASVFASDCTTADAWATAFMVMGFEEARAKMEKLEGIEAIFIYSDDAGDIQTFMTPGIREHVTLE